MLRILEAKGDIEDAQSRFESQMRDFADQTPTITFGRRGKSWTEQVQASSRLGIWWTADRRPKRYWYVFGIIEPGWIQKHNDIVVEINSPISGRDWHTGGAYASGDDSIIRVVHRGNIAGGKIRFWRDYDGEVEDIQDGKKISRFAMIGEIGDSELPKAVAKFVREVNRIKRI
jgi:hypothetical protein